MSWQAECFSPLGLLKWQFNLFPADSYCYLALDLPMQPNSISFLYYVKLFVLTCGLESPFYFFSSRLRYRSRILQILLLNLATHPAVTWLFPLLTSKAEFSNGLVMEVSEAFAFITEALILIFYYEYRPTKGLFVALAANLTSWWVGLLLI